MGAPSLVVAECVERIAARSRVLFLFKFAAALAATLLSSCFHEGLSHAQLLVCPSIFPSATPQRSTPSQCFCVFARPSVFFSSRAARVAYDFVEISVRSA